jgi:sugar-specific transcriptional regulator TrmB
MQKEEIAQTLQKFGLTEYESKAYVSLVLLGPAKAADISKDSLVPQSKIYVTLESLMEKQLIEVFEGRPKQYRAVAPQSVIKDLIEEKKEEFVDLKQKAFAISALLRPIEADEEVVEGLWVQRGEKYMEVLDRLAQMLRKARDYVYDVTRDFSYSSKYREAVLNCKRRGVKLHIMAMRIGEDNYQRAKWYLEHGIKLKVFDASVHPRIMVVDGEEVSIRLDHDTEKNRFGFHSIWSRDPSFVSMMDNYLKSLWESAREVNSKSVPILSH